MTADEITKLIEDSIAGRFDESNSHGVELRSALTTPTPARMIERLKKDTIVDVWLVLRECPEDDGYLIFYHEGRYTFGLAATGFPDDKYPVICGYYGDFWTAFKGM